MANGIMTGRRRGPPPSALGGGGALVEAAGRDGTARSEQMHQTDLITSIRQGAGRLISADCVCHLEFS